MSEKYNQISPFIRPHFREMEGYVSAGMQSDKAAKLIFLNANENPYALPGLEGAGRYPEPQPKALVQALAKLYSVHDNELLVTRGADEAIALLFRLFCDPAKDDVLLNPPTFGVYQVYGGGVPCRHVLHVPLVKKGGTFHLDIQGILNALNDPENTIKMIVLINPNNPTGNCFPASDIQSVIDAAKGKAIVVLDETYAEFKPESSFTDKINKHPHLIILRTLSKSFALAGMRIGAILSGVPELIETLRSKVMEIYPISAGSIEAALKVLSPETMAIAKDNIQILIAERKRMEKFWATQGFVHHVYPSDANFLLIEMERASAFCDYCKENSVILRDFSSAPLTAKCLRISIGTPEQNNLLIKLANEFYN